MSSKKYAGNEDRQRPTRDLSKDTRFREKLEELLGLIISEGSTADRLRSEPEVALREFGFSDSEIEAFRDVSFNVVLTGRPGNLLQKGGGAAKPPDPEPLPCSPDDPTKTLVIVFKSGETVTGGKFFIDLDDFASDV